MSDFFKGMALPWGVTVRSVFDPKDDKDILKSSILWIIMTRLGERVMLPEFGTSVPDLVFEPNDSVSAETISGQVQDAIARWDDRIEFRDFKVSGSENTMHCTLTYTDRLSNLSNSDETVEFDIMPSGFTG